MKPLVFQIKADVDPNIEKAFGLLVKLASTAGQSAQNTGKTYAEIAREIEELARAAAKAAKEFEKADQSQKRPKTPTSAPDTSKDSERKKAAADLQFALKEEAKYNAAVQQSGVIQANAVRKAEQEKAEARRKAAAELTSAMREEAKRTSAQVTAAREEAKATADAALTTMASLRDMSDSLQEIGGGGAQQLQGLSDTLFGLASKAADTAKSFETFEAQLKTVLGTQVQAEAVFSSSKDFAVATPFDVAEIVEATVTLEAYKQRSQEVLPLVAALAAGMTKELSATSLVVGKAMSGSLEGFESLRNEYGITTRELAKYGAETNKTGGIMVQTSGQIDKARNALAQIVKLRFGDALADRAKTVSAALSNAGDAALNFSADVGEGVAPFIRLAAVLTEKLFTALQAMPTAMKAGTGAALVLGAGVTGLGAIALTTTVALFRLDLELKKIAASNTAAAAATGLTSAQMGVLTVTSSAASAGATTTTAAITAMGSAASLAGKAFIFLTSTPLGLALTGIAVAGAAAHTAINAYGNANVEAGRKVAETSRNITKMTFEARQLAEVLKELGGEEIRTALAHKTLGERSAALAEAIKKIPVGELAAKLKGMNLGPEELKTVLAGVKDQATAVKAELQDLMKEREDMLRRHNGLSDGFMGALGVKDNFDETSGLNAQFDALDAKIQDTLGSLKVLGNVAALFTPVQNSVSDATAKFDALAKASQRALDFSKYAGQAGGEGALRTALVDIQARIDANNKALAGKGQSGSKDGILATLRSGNHDDSLKAALEAQLELYSALEAGEEKLAASRAQAGEKRLSDIEKDLSREKALRDVSREDELASIDKAIAAARDLGEKGIDDEVRLLEEKKSRAAEWAKEDLEITKKGLDEQLAVSKSFVERLNSEGAPQGEIVAAYDRMIAKLKEWQAAHGPLLTTNKELAQQVSQTMRGFENDKATAQSRLLDNNLKALKNSLEAIGNETEANAVKLGASVTNAQKLEAVERQIDLATKAQTSSAYKVGEIDKVLVELAKERLGLEQTITQAKLRQAGDMQKLAIEGIQKELELLELRRDAGLNVDAQLAAKSAELREARIKDLELVYQAEREAADDKLAVEAKYQLARTNLEKDFSIEAQRQADKRVDIAKGEQAKLSRADAKSTTQAEPSRPTTQRDETSSSQSAPVTASPFTVGKGFQLRERNQAAREAQRAGFAQGNSAAVGMVAEQDAERAARAQQALDERRKQNAAATNARQQDAAARQKAAEAAQTRYQQYDAVKRGIPARPMTDDEYTRLLELRKPGAPASPGAFKLAPLPDELKAASPRAMMQSSAQPPAVKGAESKAQSVSNNQSYTANISVEGGGVANLTADPRFRAEVIRVVEDEFRRQGYRDGGAGWV